METTGSKQLYSVFSKLAKYSMVLGITSQDRSKLELMTFILMIHDGHQRFGPLYLCRKWLQLKAEMLRPGFVEADCVS